MRCVPCPHTSLVTYSYLHLPTCIENPTCSCFLFSLPSYFHFRQVEAAEKAKTACALRGDHEKVLDIVMRINQAQIDIAALVSEQSILQSKADKAARDARSRAAGKSIDISTDADADLPAVPDNLQGASLEHLALVRRLREQLGQTDTFSRTNTRFGRLHCSPLDPGLDDYIAAQTSLQLLNNDKPTSGKGPSRRQFLIKAASAMRSLPPGGRKLLNTLWSEINGPSGLNAQPKILQLMKAPLVCIRMDSGDGASAWVVIAKQPDVDYARMDHVLEALEPLPTGPLSSKPVISRTRLRALQALATTSADRKLLVLAAIDGCSIQSVCDSGLLGTHDLGTSEQRRQREEALATALATFEAFR